MAITTTHNNECLKLIPIPRHWLLFHGHDLHDLYLHWGLNMASTKYTIVFLNILNNRIHLELIMLLKYEQSRELNAQKIKNT